MSLISGIRIWWQAKTGEDETPLDGYAPVWLVSLVVHLVGMFVLAFIPVSVERDPGEVTLVAPPAEELDLEVVEVPQDFMFSEQPAEEVGANSLAGTDMAFSEALVVADFSDVPSPVEETPTEDYSDIEINNVIETAVALHYSENLPVVGAVGEGTTGASGAVDRITHEILLSLEERKTLVVWLFDQSASLERERQTINDRFAKIYEELGVIEAAGNPAFAKHDDKPLLTSVVAFGSNVELLTPQPTDNIDEIQSVVAGIPRDETGVERVFQAVYSAANEYKSYRIPAGESKEPARNVMIVVFTDEAGEDYQGLDKTVQVCRRYEMPVYVVGVPAPFGKQETLVKWVDPNPDYDQAPQWGRVDQGPESLMVERVKISFSGEEDPTMDSGFGPFALTRLCYETGGIYFTVHPNRNVNRAVSRRETAEFSAYMEYFFDPNVMRRYRPDYVSTDEYVRRAKSNQSRTALLEAAKLTQLQTMENPRTRFEKRDEAAFANALTEAQKDAAKLEPKIDYLYGVLKTGEGDREKETTPRWQAGYDLAMGRVMANMVRTKAYNLKLAEAKRGLTFKNSENNTWVLDPSDDLEGVGSQIEKAGEKAREYLQRVVDSHPDTPWALLAKKELETPLGWTWKEEYTKPPEPRMGGGGNNNVPGNDEARKIERPKPSRPVPKL